MKTREDILSLIGELDTQMKHEDTSEDISNRNEIVIAKLTECLELLHKRTILVEMTRSLKGAEKEAVQWVLSDY